MNRGYTFLLRKTWGNLILQEKRKRFSRFEAWLHLTNVLEAGVDDPSAELQSIIRFFHILALRLVFGF